MISSKWWNSNSKSKELKSEPIEPTQSKFLIKLGVKMWIVKCELQCELIEFQNGDYDINVS